MSLNDLSRRHGRKDCTISGNLPTCSEMGGQLGGRKKRRLLELVQRTRESSLQGGHKYGRERGGGLVLLFSED